MFDWLLPDNHAVAILKKDHDKVKALFDQFEKEESRPGKNKIIQEAIEELKIHAILEEEIFYPAVRKQVGPDMMNEADEEHHVAKLLIGELESMTDRDDHRDAKFTVLSENVRHHIQEEENELMPKAKSADIDFERIGNEMLKRKQQLKTHGVPVAAEEKLMATNPNSDSPAAAAHRKPARRTAKTVGKRTRTAAKKSKESR